MNCPVCEDIGEIIKNGDDYELWCDCGYHKVIELDKTAELRQKAGEP